MDANLVDYRTGEIRPDVSVPGLTLAQLTNRKNELAAQLARQEALML